MKKVKKIASLSLIICMLSVVPFQDTYAGKYRQKYGHSRISCWWMTVNLVIFNKVLKEGTYSTAKHGHNWDS